MKPGLALGQTARVETTVTEEMFAQFEGTVVHPAYSTVSMVYHMEWAARKIILPYLESSEEGVGGAVNVKHLNMAPLGSTGQHHSDGDRTAGQPRPDKNRCHERTRVDRRRRSHANHFG